MRIGFGDFVLDTDQRRLVQGIRDVLVSPKAFDLLKLLVETRPKALTKDEIFSRLWADTFVTENTLASVVAELRRALDDDARSPRFIRTVYAYGYAFVAEAAEEESSAGAALPSAWKLIHLDREIPLREGQNVLGRVGPGVVVLDDATISRRHACISIAGPSAVVADLGSKNGTWLGAEPVTAPTTVEDGAELRLGSVVVVVRFAPDASSTETVGVTR